MTRAKSAQASADNSEVIRLTSDEINHKKLRVRKLHKFTILHYSPFKAVWDWFVLLLVVYTAIFTPYSAVFLLRDDQERSRLNKDPETRTPEGPSESYTNPLVIIDLIVDVMFIVDIFINFRTTFIDDQKGEVVSDPAKIAKHYLKGWFVIDVLAAIPFDLLMFGLATDERTTTAMGLLKTARLLRLLRVARRVDHYSQYAPAVVILLMCAFSLVAHWLACIWYAIGEAQRVNIPYGWLWSLSLETDQPYRNDSTAGPTLESRYITSLYFTLTTLTTVGFGNVAPNTDAEKLFAIIIMLLGSLMFAIIFGNMTAIIDRLYEGMSRYHQQMNLVKEFVRFHNVPTPLRVRLQEYFKHAWVNMNGNDIEEVSQVMKDFPDFLQADISLHLNRNLLKSSIAFQGVNQGCLRSLSIRLQTTHTAPGDILIHKGDKLNVMYFISRGSLEILQGNIVLAILGLEEYSPHNSSFGERHQIFIESSVSDGRNWRNVPNEWRVGERFAQGKNDVVGENFCQNETVGRSKGTVRALTYCDLLTLSRSDLNEVCELYPEFRKHFAEKVEVTIDMRDQLEGSDSEQQPMIPEECDVEAGKFPTDSASLPRKRRAGADLHTRVTLTPVPSKESVQRSGDEGTFKGASNRPSTMLLMQMQIERGHMAQENVKTVPVSMEDISRITEENNNTGSLPGETESESGSKAGLVPGEQLQKTRKKPSSKHVNFRLSADNAAQSSPNLSSETKNGLLPSAIPPFRSREVLVNQGTPDTTKLSLSDAIRTHISPEVIVNEGQPGEIQLHRRIDGLYDQLNMIESRFDEQRAAIIDFILASHDAQQATRYMQIPTPDSGSGTEDVSRDNPTPQDAHNLLQNGENAPAPLVGDADQLEMSALPPSSPKAKSFPNIASDTKDNNVPSYYQMQLQSANANSGGKYQKSTLPRPGRRKGPSSSAGHVSTASWNPRSPGRGSSSSSSIPSVAAKDCDQVWFERSDNDRQHSSHSSTDC